MTGKITRVLADKGYGLPAAEYATLQDAIDEAKSKNIALVKVPPGTYSAITVPSGVTVAGSNHVTTGSNETVIESGAGYAVELAGNSAAVKRLHIDDGNGGSGVKVANNVCRVMECAISGNVDFVAADWGNCVNNYLRTNDITLDADSEKNVVTANTRVGSISDSGTGNDTTGNS